MAEVVCAVGMEVVHLPVSRCCPGVLQHTLTVVVIRESISRQQFDAALNVTTCVIWY